MIYRLFKWLFGYCKITLKGSPSAAATLFLRKQINVNHLMPTENGVFFEVMLYERKKTLKLLKDYSFEVTDCKACGLPARLSRYRKRWGLILGALLCAAIIWASSLFLWQIDVVGNETLSDAEVLSLLEDHGFSVGSYLPSLSVKELCNDCLLSEPRLAYLSVNVIGTHCEVQIKETKQADPMPDDLPSDLVAACDGQIWRLEVYAGQAILKAGETVRAGQVVVSGLSELPDGSFRLGKADGKVYAKILREFSVTVPFETEIKVYTGESIQNKSILFFKKKIKLFKNSGISGSGYDTIETSSSLNVGEGLVLPVGIATTEYRPYTMLPYTRSEEEVRRIAEAQMADLLSAELADSEVLTISRAIRIDEKGCTLDCAVYCITDIAKAHPIVGLPEATESGD